jgi:S-formylglutathione hydrolase FrmB
MTRRDSRAIEGYSMGGFGAAHFGFKYPDLFGAVSIMAGALLDRESVPTRSELGAASAFEFYKTAFRTP